MHIFYFDFRYNPCMLSCYLITFIVFCIQGIRSHSGKAQTFLMERKNGLVCLDGTWNQFKDHYSNVIKLF